MTEVWKETFGIQEILKFLLEMKIWSKNFGVYRIQNWLEELNIVISITSILLVGWIRYSYMDMVLGLVTIQKMLDKPRLIRLPFAH